jgi:VanZ family protein
MTVFKTKLTILEILQAYLPAILWASIIFAFSSQSVLPGLGQTVLDFIFKKSAHVLVYLILYLFLFSATKKTISKENRNLVIFLPIFLTLVYAVSDEFHQSLVPGRFSAARDVGFDMIGVLIGFLKKHNYI